GPRRVRAPRRGEGAAPDGPPASRSRSLVSRSFSSSRGSMPAMTPAPVTDVGGRYALVVSRSTAHVPHRLLDAALETFRKNGVDIDARTTVLWVPGSFELPLVCKRL